MVQDSYETGGQNWTDDMLAAFKKKYKYDPIPYLPSLQGIVIGSPDMSDRFLWDLRRLVADRIAYDYVGGLREVGHRHGLTTWLENYGHWGFPGEFLQYGGQSDEIGGEFWSEGSLGDIETGQPHPVRISMVKKGMGRIIHGRWLQLQPIPTYIETKRRPFLYRRNQQYNVACLHPPALGR